MLEHSDNLGVVIDNSSSVNESWAIYGVNFCKSESGWCAKYIQMGTFNLTTLDLLVPP